MIDISPNRFKLVAAVCVGGLALLIGSVTTARTLLSKEPPAAQTRRWVTAERIRSGDKIRVKPDDDVLYAGIRAPFPGEPFDEESKARNAELVQGEHVRLRFDELERDKKGRLLAYAFVGDVFVNELLVREGLAYVRLTSTTQRFAQELLAAQTEARRAKRGLWSSRRSADESEYNADPKYGNFHRPSCQESENTPDERKVRLDSARDAFDRGFAPCHRCRP